MKQTQPHNLITRDLMAQIQCYPNQYLSIAKTYKLSSRWVNVAAWFGRKMWLPAVQHSMMVSAMSLLLVFRTNSAYQRFAEGRLVVLI